MIAESDRASPVGAIFAIPEEIDEIFRHEKLEEPAPVIIGDLKFLPVDLAGRPVVMVLSGCGKVNAAMTATILLQVFGCRSLIFSGVAGGCDPALSRGDVVVADYTVQHDYGALVQERLTVYRPGVVPVGLANQRQPGWDLPPGRKALLSAALDSLSVPELPAEITGTVARRPQIVFGPIVTGDSFVNCEKSRIRLWREFGARAVDMESAAVVQVAERFFAPWVIIRCLSDLAGAESHMDFAKFAQAAASVSACIMMRVIPVC